MINRREFVLFAAAAASRYLAYPKCAFADSYEQIVTETFSNNRDFEQPSAKIMPMGRYAQSVLFSINPYLLTSLNPRIGDNADLSSIVLVPNAEGSVGFVNTEVLLEEARKFPFPLLDIGTPSKNTDESLNMVTEITGQTARFFDGSFEHLSSAYRKLGELFEQERATILADYLDEVVAIVKTRQELLLGKPKKIIYLASGEQGIHGETFKYLQSNIFDYLNCESINEKVPSFAFEDAPISIINLDDLAKQDIDAIIFKDALSIDVADKNTAVGHLWRNMPQLKAGKIFCAPITELSWIGSPLISQALGVLWLGSILYPDLYGDIDLLSYAARFYKLFIHTDKVISTLDALIEASIVEKM